MTTQTKEIPVSILGYSTGELRTVPVTMPVAPWEGKK